MTVPKPAVIGLSTSALGGLLSAESAVTDTMEDFLRPAAATVAMATDPNVRRFVGDSRTSDTQVNTDNH